MHKQNTNAFVVAGGTGNVGSHITRALLARGARVVVPSRSEQKLKGLIEYLQAHLAPVELDRLVTTIGDFGDAAQAESLAARIATENGPLAGVVATLGQFLPVPSLLAGTPAELQQALHDYPIAHYHTARALLPQVQDQGRYIFINGMLAFDPIPGMAAGMVSIATAAQHMLFRALAQELNDQRVQLAEVVLYTYVRDRTTLPGAAMTAEDTAAHIADMLVGTVAVEHGRTVHLRAAEAAGAGRAFRV